MRLGKFWKDRVTAFEVNPDNWRPRNDRVWKRFVKASARLKLEANQSIRIYQLSRCSKKQFKTLKKGVYKNKSDGS